MSCLHTISQSPSLQLLDTCASVLETGDAVIFIEDGIYYCNQKESLAEFKVEFQVYSLVEDMNARGMLKRNLIDAELVNYQQFVELCCEYDKVVSWF